MHKPENLIAGSAAGATARTTAVLVAPRKKPELEKPVEVALQPWGVQVGAFYDASPAKRAAAKVAQRFPDLLGETLIMTPTIKGRRGDIYRARLMGLSEERARNACKRLRSARIDCLVVRSRETIKVALN
jgi:D-alanyl-D-alanine carboxypeptidase